jgi:outer membrane protein assembly factor BamB
VAVADGVVYLSSEDGYVYALDAATGDRRWKFAAERYVSAPTVVDRTVYLGGGDGELTVVDARTGKRRWRTRIGKAPFVGAPTASPTPWTPTPAGSGGRSPPAAP